MTCGIVCLGFADLDVIHRVEAPPVWGRKGVCTSVELAAGGPATNAAVTAAALLGGATLVTALGEGPAAAIVRDDLARHRVEVIDCAPDGWSVPVAGCLVAPAGERTVVSPSGVVSTFGLTETARAAVAAAGGLLLDGHHPVAAREALDVRGPGSVVVLDAGSVKLHAEAWLADLDVVAGSADYAAGLGVGLEDAMRHVLDAGAGVAVMTDGPDPVVWATADDPIPRRVSPPRVQARDTLGAGDAFHGALVAGLVQGHPLADAVERACAVAALRVTVAGSRAWLAELGELAD